MYLNVAAYIIYCIKLSLKGENAIIDSKTLKLAKTLQSKIIF